MVRAATDGVVTGLDAMGVGVAAWRLGAGRARKEDAVQPAAGVLCLAKPGEPVRVGQPVFELCTDDDDRIPEAVGLVEAALTVAAHGTTVPRDQLILDVLR